MLEVGVLKTFDSGTYKAGVQFAGSLTTYMDDIAVSVSIISTAMVLGNYVLVAIPGDNPKDACVVATWPDSGRIPMSKMPDGTAGHVLTAQGAGADPAYAAPAGPGTASRCRAYLGSSQSITTATYTRVNLDTELFDSLAEFDTANHKFTASAAGYYLVSASLAWDSYVADHEVLLAIYKNDAIIARANQAQTATSNAIIICASQIVYLAANDYVELYARHTFGADTSLVEGDAYTHMAIHKLS